MVPGFLHVQSLEQLLHSVMVVLLAHGYFPTLCCAVWAQQLLLPVSLLAVLLAGKVLLLALHSLSHSVVEVVVARLDHLGYQLEEGVKSELVGMEIRHGSPAHILCCSLLWSREGPRMSFSPGRFG